MTLARRISLLLVPLVLVLVAGIGLFLATRGEAADQATSGTYYFRLIVGGAEAGGFFKEAKITGGSVGVVSRTTVDEQGKSMVRLFPGQRKHWTITLDRGVDASPVLWEWYKQVLDGKIDEARRDILLEIVDWEGKAVLTYSLLRAWPRAYNAPELYVGGQGASEQAPLTERVTIVAESMARV